MLSKKVDFALTKFVFENDDIWVLVVIQLLPEVLDLIQQLNLTGMRVFGQARLC